MFCLCLTFLKLEALFLNWKHKVTVPLLEVSILRACPPWLFSSSSFQLNLLTSVFFFSFSIGHKLDGLAKYGKVSKHFIKEPAEVFFPGKMVTAKVMG